MPRQLGMGKIEVRQLKCDLTPVAGLALVGDHFKSFEPVLKLLDKTLPMRAGVANSDILRSYLGLLVQGKSDFDAIENHRGDKFYKHALGIELLTSSPTLRQGRDAQGRPGQRAQRARASDDRDAAEAPPA